MKKQSVQLLTVGEELGQLRREKREAWLILIQNGELDVLVRDKRHHASAGELVLLTDIREDQRLCPGEGFCAQLLQIDKENAELWHQRFFLTSKVRDEKGVVLPLGDQLQSIGAIFQNMAKLQKASDTMMLDMLLQELLAKLYLIAGDTWVQSYTNKSAIVIMVRQMLDKEYATEYTTASIAAKYNMSASRMAHIFKEIAGISVMRYLLLVRVDAAKRYLVQTHMPIQEIADMCGFNDLSNFGRTFRKETGYSPRQYRNYYKNTAAASEE